jgi:hypothetical protein
MKQTGLAVWAALGLGLASCGGGDDATTTTSGSSSGSGGMTGTGGEMTGTGGLTGTGGVTSAGGSGGMGAGGSGGASTGGSGGMGAGGSGGASTGGSGGMSAGGSGGASTGGSGGMGAGGSGGMASTGSGSGGMASSSTGAMTGSGSGSGGMASTGSGAMASSSTGAMTGSGSGGAGGGGPTGLHFDFLGSYPGAVGSGNSEIVAEDMDGDGKRDLVVSNPQGGFVGVLLGAGNGTFQELGRVYPPGTYSYASLAVADFNGDGKKDVAVTSRDPAAGLHVYLNQGNGSLLAPVLYATSFTIPGQLTQADLDGDGDRDIAVVGALGASVNVFSNNGSGVFTLSSNLRPAVVGGFNDVAAGDLDGDGITDIACAEALKSSIQFFKGLGGGGFASGVALPARKGGTIDLGDVNGDGKLDVVLGSQPTTNNGFAVCLNNGNGTLAAPVVVSSTNYVSVKAVADADGDGDLDVFASNNNGQGAYVSKNQGGVFAALASIGGGPSPAGMAAGDLDGDGDIDVAIGNVDPGLRVLLNNAMGGYLAPVDKSYGAGARMLTAGDFDGDGKPDAIFGSSGPVLTVYRGLGGGTLGYSGTLDIAGAPGELFAVHADGDMALDLVAVNGCSPTSCDNVQTFLGAGNGTFLAPITSLQDLGYSDADMGDLDGDGDLDLHVTVDPNNGASFLRSNGDGTFTEDFGAGPPAVDAEAFADFDGDGTLDFVGADTFNSFTLHGNGNATFAAASPSLPMVDLTKRIVVGDVNGDGYKDFLATARQSDKVTLMLGAGNGTLFTPTVLSLGLGISTSPVLADLDGDGDDDFIVIAGDQVVILLWDMGMFQPGPAVTGVTRPSSVAARDMNGDGRKDLLVTSLGMNALVVLLNKP